MAKSKNQKLKLPYLIRIMLDKTDEEHGLTLDQIKEELGKYDVGAERKSLYNDFDDMTDRFDIEVQNVRKGRETYYYVSKRDFELAEVKLLIDAIQCAKFITESRSRELIKKVKKLVSKNQAQQLQRQVFVQGRVKTMNASVYYNVDEIYNAINHKKKIKFRYFRWNPDKTKYYINHGGWITASPFALTWCDEYYYLIAFDDYEKMCKHYRVDKIEKIQEIDEKLDGVDEFKNFDMAAYSKATFGMFGGKKKTVKFHLTNELVNVFIDRFGQDISIRPIDEGHCAVNVEVYVSSQFYGWVFSLGNKVKIVGPDDVVEGMKKQIKEVSDIMER